MISLSCFCAELPKNANMLKKYHVSEKKIIPGRPNIFGLSKLYTNLPHDMPEGCIYFWGVSFQWFSRNNFFFRKNFLKSIEIWPFWTIFFVLEGIGKNAKSPFSPIIRMIYYFYYLFRHIRWIKSLYFEFLAISVF